MKIVWIVCLVLVWQESACTTVFPVHKPECIYQLTSLPAHESKDGLFMPRTETPTVAAEIVINKTCFPEGNSTIELRIELDGGGNCSNVNFLYYKRPLSSCARYIQKCNIGITYSDSGKLLRWKSYLSWQDEVMHLSESVLNTTWWDTNQPSAFGTGTGIVVKATFHGGGQYTISLLSQLHSDTAAKICEYPSISGSCPYTGSYVLSPYTDRCYGWGSSYKTYNGMCTASNPTTSGNVVAVTNQNQFENLRFVLDAIIAQKNWHNLNNVEKLWWTGVEGEAYVSDSSCKVSCDGEELIILTNTESRNITSLSLSQMVEMEETLQNVALNKTAWQSGTTNGGLASFAVDGNRDADFAALSCIRTEERLDSWWAVSLGRKYLISHVTLVSRKAPCDASCDDLTDFDVRVGTNSNDLTLNQLCYHYDGLMPQESVESFYCIEPLITSSYVSVHLVKKDVNTTLTFCELEVYGIASD